MSKQLETIQAITDLYAKYYNNKITLGELTDGVENIIQTKVKEARIEEVDRLLADKELDLEWYLRYDGSENMNPQESGEENVASAVKEYATNRLATLSTPEQTKQEKKYSLDNLTNRKEWQEPLDNISSLKKGCEHCSGENDKPGWKGSYSDDGYIGYVQCWNCNNASRPPTSKATKRSTDND